MAETEIKVIKDEANELPIPSIWRPVFRNIVRAFAAHDYLLNTDVQGVERITNENAEQIKEYISDYGEELIELPEETWDSSIYIWMGSRWDVLIDLWTADEGRSDMVLSAQVMEEKEDFIFHINMVYVP